MNIKDFLSPLLDDEKGGAPYYRYYLAAWLGHNWEAVVIFLHVKQDKIETIKKLYTEDWHAWYRYVGGPAIVALIAVALVPYARIALDRIHYLGTSVRDKISDTRRRKRALELIKVNRAEAKNLEYPKLKDANAQAALLNNELLDLRSNHRELTNNFEKQSLELSNSLNKNKETEELHELNEVLSSQLEKVSNDNNKLLQERKNSENTNRNEDFTRFLNAQKAITAASKMDDTINKTLQDQKKISDILSIDPVKQILELEKSSLKNASTEKQ